MRLNIPDLKGQIYVVAGKEDDEDKGQVIISGDPEGLRSLANVLMAVAKIDQSKSLNLPDFASEHIHLHAGVHIGTGDLETHDLIVGRLDFKNGKLASFYEPCNSIIREIKEERD